MQGIRLRKIKLEESQDISMAFKLQGWDKPVSQYENYFRMQEAGTRDVIIAEFEQAFVGYLTIKWESSYPAFKAKGIPEIVDFNVLKKFQRKGIGSALMDEAEKRVSGVSPICGIGVGMLEDYGAAQILYIKRGYIPDGKGLMYAGKQLVYGDEVVMGDEVVLHLSKVLEPM